MPTGYTEKLMDQGQSFRDFAMLCARAFSACILMRDDPLDTPIPEKFEPSNYHLKGRAEDEAEVKRLEAMTPEEQRAFGEARRREQIDHYCEALGKNVRENERLEAMAAQVEAWQPPTPIHQNFKKFMLEQLRISANRLEYYQDELRQARARLPYAFYVEALDKAKRSIAYHEEEYQREVERCAERTRWIQELRASLPEK